MENPNQRRQMDIDELLSADLRVHAGGTRNLGINPYLARFLHDSVSPTHSTLETGVGLSTVIFAIRGSSHIAITPSEEEVNRIKEFCKKQNISMDKIRFIINYSDEVLPALDLSPLDLVLIDGGHGFPVPYIDWRYTAPSIKIGGRLVIDDCQIETGAVLRDFLRDEPAWVEEQDFFGRTSVFKLKAQHALKEWSQQPYIVRRSRRLRFLQNAKEAASLAARGDFSRLGSALLKRVRRN
jgi:hypothetical protein